MDPRIAVVSLVGGWLPWVVNLTAVGLLGVALIRRLRRGCLRSTLVAVGLGVGVGLFSCWLLSDQLNLFDVSLTPISRAWVAAAFAGAAVAVTEVFGTGRLRRVFACALIPLSLLAGGLGVNADFGQYTTIGSLAGGAVAAPFPESELAIQAIGAPGGETQGFSDSASDPLWKSTSRAGIPQHGVLGTVTIPATVSHFAARSAYLYLPPAALVAHPVALPVMIILAGQPGGPSNMVASGRLIQIVGDFAATHAGLAPIVVVPDQLAAPQLNPLCVDSKMGNSATYLTVDVPKWIRSHLTVQTTAAAWSIGGFSQGGTCAIQLGSAYPGLFGGIFDISGQVAPKIGNKQMTIRDGFGGSTVAYTTALPLSLLAKNAPFRDTVAVFISGQLDSKYGRESDKVYAAAKAAGMRATRAISPGTGHDWHTVQWALRTQLAPIFSQLGVEQPAS